MKLVKDTDNKNNLKQISDKEAEEAFKTILAWMGEDPNRAVSYTHLTLPTKA